MNDYNENLDSRVEKNKNNYSESKNMNKKLFQENVEIYINDKRLILVLNILLKIII